MKRINLLIFAILTILITTIIPSGLFSELDKDIAVIFLGEKSDSIYGLNLFITKLFNPVNAVILCAVAVITLIAIKKWRYGFYIAFTMMLSTAINEGIKSLYTRVRPPYAHFLESGYSFPSGHSAAAACFFACIYLIVRNNTSSKKTWRITAVFATLFGVYVAFTRLYFGVHYPTDVAGGLMWGLFLANVMEYLMYSAGIIYRKELYYMG